MERSLAFRSSDGRDARSALADRAEEGAAAGLDLAIDRAPASGGAAGFALTAIDRPGMLEVAEFAINLDIVAQGRAAGRDRPLQHRLDLRHQPGRPDSGDRGGDPAGRDPRR